MNNCDFTFRGETLSSHGYILCDFEPITDLSTIDTDSLRNFSVVSLYNGKYTPFIFSKYEDGLSMRLSICKDTNNDDYIIQPKETSKVKRWLSSPCESELRVSDSAYSGIFWIGSFNVEEVHHSSGCVGFNLEFKSTAPFGYKDVVTLSGDLVGGGSISINDTSDEEGYIYPELSITTKMSGDLTITNEFDGRKTILKNCVSNETITFNNLLQVYTNIKSHNVYDDFNFKFPRVCNTYRKTSNVFTVNLPCKYSLSYRPIAKVVYR